jgi:hypothetical protein
VTRRCWSGSRGMGRKQECSGREGVDKAVKVLSLHPLQVEVVFSNGENNVFMTFNWLVVLGVVMVTITLTTKDKVEGEALNPNTLLSPLYNGDSGLESPNTNSWQLAAAGLTDSLDNLLPDKLPYLWVQRLDGLDFLSVEPSEDPEECEDGSQHGPGTHTARGDHHQLYQSQAGVQDRPA